VSKRFSRRWRRFWIYIRVRENRNVNDNDEISDPTAVRPGFRDAVVLVGGLE
jgi:hypothetical protein